MRGDTFPEGMMCTAMNVPYFALFFMLCKWMIIKNKIYLFLYHAGTVKKMNPSHMALLQNFTFGRSKYTSTKIFVQVFLQPGGYLQLAVATPRTNGGQNTQTPARMHREHAIHARCRNREKIIGPEKQLIRASRCPCLKEQDGYNYFENKLILPQDRFLRT